MKQTTKKSMSVLLLLCFVLTLLPVSALADSAKETETKEVRVTFTDTTADGTIVNIGTPEIPVPKNTERLSASDAQVALDKAMSISQGKEYILADPDATYEITKDATEYTAVVPVKEATITVEAIFQSNGETVGETLSIPNVKGSQKKLDETQIAYVKRNIPDGYLLASKQDYTIPEQGNLVLIVQKQNVSLVTLIASPKEAVEGVDAYSTQMGQDLDGKITVTDTWYIPKEGYELKQILAYGFNGKTDYMKVEKGDRLTPNQNTKHTIKYEYVSTEKTADIAVTAYPDEAVKGNSKRTISLSLDDKDSVKVPNAADVFTTVEGYEPAEIYASGFNGKNGAVLVKAGDVLKVTGKTPELRYEYNEVKTVQKVSFLAGPLSAVTGTGSLDKELPQDQDGKITVPKDTDIFTPQKGYVLKEISATGFEKKTGTFTVKAGDKLTVSDKNPVIKYTYEAVEVVNPVDTNVTMTINSKKLLVNGQTKTIDVAPMIKQSRTYVPLRALVEAFGAQVDFYEANHTVIAKLDGTKVVMVIGSKTYTVNGVAHTMDVAPFITDSRTMVPIRFIAEAFGIEVTPTYHPVDGTTATVEFKK